MSLTHLGLSYVELGRWDEALAIGAQLPEPDEEGGDHPLKAMARSTLIPVLVNRGAVAEAEELYAPLREKRSSGELQERYVEAYFRALLLRARGRMTEALEAGETAMALKEALSGRILRYGTVEALEAAFELGDVGRVEKLIALIEAETPQASSPHLRAQAARFRAKLAAAQDEGDVAARGFERAAATFREIKAPFWLAVVLLEHGEWLVRAGRAGEADRALDEAAESQSQSGPVGGAGGGPAPGRCCGVIKDVKNEGVSAVRRARPSRGEPA